MLGVDDGGDAPAALRLSGDGERESGLTGGFRAEDLDDSAAGDALAAEGKVQRDGAGGDARDRQVGVLVELHDRALAEGLLDLPDGLAEGLELFLGWLEGLGDPGGGLALHLSDVGGGAVGRGGFPGR